MTSLCITSPHFPLNGKSITKTALLFKTFFWYGFLTPSPSNQIFPILPKALIAHLQQQWSFYVWQPMDDDHDAVRLVASWATPQEQVQAFVQKVKDF